MTVDDALIARGFWGPRQESPDRIADKLVAFLAAVDEVVGERIRWASHRLPGQSIAERANALQVIADAFRENTDAPHLGINQAFDGCGQRFEAVSITMGVGRYSDSPKVQNAFVLKWRGTDVVALAHPIVRQLVSAWDPDWADVTSMSLRDALAGVQPTGSPGPKVGYLSYLSEGRAQALPGGLGEHLQELENGGILIGSGEGEDFLPVDKVGELANVLRASAAFAATPTSRSKF